ncbi:MAG: HEAT repeat domain-containing protein [Acidobacteriota bacterium]
MRKTPLLLFILLFTTASGATSLRDAASQGASSIAWKIRTRGVSICCCREGQGWNESDRNRIEYRDILLIASLQGRKVTDLRMVEPNCPLDAGVRMLPDVTAGESIDFVIEHLGDPSDEGRLVAALAMHDHPRVIPALIELERHHADSDIRRHALFWLGQRAGEKAAGELRRAVDEDPEDDVREHAVFAISQLPRERAVPMLIDLVKHHKRPRVRQRAMFWLAESGDPRAMDLIEEILGTR